MAVVETAAVSTVARRFRWIPSSAVDETGPEPPTKHLPGLGEMEHRGWEAFRESSALLLEALNRQLVDTHQMTLIDFLVLDLLARSQTGSARMGDLAQALVLGPSRVTQQVSRMESRRLVRRSRSTKDGRGVVANITPEGRARMRPAAKTYAQLVREVYLDQMARREMIAMGDSCRRINYPLKKIHRPE